MTVPPSCRLPQPGRVLGVCGAVAAALAVLAASGCSSPLTAAQISATENHYVGAPRLTPPKVDVTVSRPGIAPGYLFLGPTGPGQRGPEIVDNSGQPVWFQPSPPGLHAMDVRVQTYRGQRVLTYWQGVTHHDVGYGNDVILNDHYQQIAVVHAGNGLQADLHEFLITKANTALITAYQSIPYDLSRNGGSSHDHVLDAVIQEINITTGKVLFQWRASAHIPVSASYRSRSQDGSQPWDYFHVNSIDVEPDGNLLISARNTHALYEINRHTGQVMWTLGGKDSSFAMGPGAQFAWQHDASRQPDGTITLFDDEGSPEVMDRSRALTLRVDESSHTVSLVRSLVSPDHVRSSSQGSMQMLPDGNTLVGYGNEPYVTEFNRAGKVVFDAKLVRPGEDSYRAYRYRWTGLPTTSPDVALRAAGPGRWTAYTSWNGATRVTGWQILEGRSRAHMAVIDTVPRQSFQTATRFSGVPGDVMAVCALNRAGRCLRRSSVEELPRS